MIQPLEDTKQQIVEILDNSFKEELENEEEIFISDEESFVNHIDSINEEVIILIENNQQQEALLLLQKAEKMLNFLANCGKPIDRNLIIVILYNEASVYQSLWELEKSQKFIDGVIYNLELLVSEQPMSIYENSTDQQIVKIKRLSFLAKVYLQYCAVLSQLSQHDTSLLFAKKSVNVLNEMFALCLNVGKTFSSKSEPQLQKTKYQSNKEGQQLIIEEVQFSQLVITAASKFLNSINENLQNQIQDEKTSLFAAQKQVYFWKTNPENNEKHLREQLNVPMVINPGDSRSLIGVQNELDWIQQFNIGTIMHISPIQYSNFALQGELLYEFSQKVLLEKVLYLSIAYFTIATEMRFIEIDKTKISNKSETYQQSKQFKLSVLYHLKSIEIACRHVQCKSPYIDHLISSFHKHYNQTLEPIVEEMSYVSQIDVDQMYQKQSPSIKAQKSLSNHYFKKEIDYHSEKDVAWTKLQQPAKKESKKIDDEGKKLLQKKLSIEGLKQMLLNLQDQVVQSTINGQKKQFGLGRLHTESGSMTKSKERYLSQRSETQTFEKSQLKSLSIGQLKKLKEDLENKKKQIQGPWNKSLNDLLSIEQRKKQNANIDLICKTERSNEENIKISKSYAVKYTQNSITTGQPMQSTKSFSNTNLITQSVNLNQVQQSFDLQRKANKKSATTQTTAQQCQTLNINIGQNYITVKQGNKPYKSKSNYQQPSQQKKSFKVDQKQIRNNTNQPYINMQMDTISKLLKESKTRS